MCGRYQQKMSPEELELLYALQRRAWNRPFKYPNFNVAPRQSVPVVVAGDGCDRVGVTMRWGIPPLWVRRQGKDPFDAPPFINAMSETAADKPTWSTALRQRRCLVPTTGFYEWIRVGKKALYPLHISTPDGSPLTLGGLWGGFDWGEDKPDWPCMAVLTTAPNAEVATVHDRSPVVVPPAAWGEWLDPGTPAGRVAELMAPLPDGALRLVEVSTALNSRKAEGPGVMAADWSTGDLEGGSGAQGADD